jgi:hypothetical protein
VGIIFLQTKGIKMSIKQFPELKEFGDKEK